MRFHLTVDLDNDAFIENPHELPDILRKIAVQVTDMPLIPDWGTALDSNGATVANWDISKEDE